MTAGAGESTLSGFARRVGTPQGSAANKPIALDTDDAVWFVLRGALDVFLHEHSGTEPIASASHLLRAGEGRLVFPMPQESVPFSVIAKGTPGTELLRLGVSEVLAAVDDPGLGGLAGEIGRQADAWIDDVCSRIASEVDGAPPPTAVVEAPGAASSTFAAGGSVAVPASSVVAARRPSVVWVSPDGADTDGGSDAQSADGVVPEASLAFLGIATPSRLPDSQVPAGRPGGSTGAVTDGPQARWLPMTADGWFTANRDLRLRTATSTDLARSGTLFEQMDGFACLVLDAASLNRRLRLADAVNAQRARRTHRLGARDRAELGLAALVGRRQAPQRQPATSLLAVLELIGGHIGAQFRASMRSPTEPPPTLRHIVDASAVRTRKVRLDASARWWRSDSGAMLGFRKDSGDPIALIPSAWGSYRAFDHLGRSVRINGAQAGDIASEAWLMYPRFAGDGPARARDAARMCWRGSGPLLAGFVAAGVVAALITQLPALALGALVDWALPFADRSAVVQVLVMLGVLSTLGVALAVFGGVLVMRIEGRAGARLSAAAWDRLLRLPRTFFRDSIAGELAVRMATFQTMRDMLAGVVASVLLSLAFLLPTLALLVAYDIVLAVVATAAALISLVVIGALGLAQMPYLRRGHSAHRKVSGLLFQFIGGMAKLRASGSHDAAFASWADAYRAQQHADIRSARYSEHLAAFGAAFPFLMAAVLCAMAIVRSDTLSSGDFVLVFAVAMTVYAAIAELGHAVSVVGGVLTGYEQIAPVLAAVPERRSAAAQPAALDGDVVWDHVSFSYGAEGPLVLDDVDIRVRSGEFIAIVGSSGSGKSTLMSLALGLETPQTGGVYLDGRDLRNFDLHAVRRQIGTVPQNGTLQPGSLLDNIIGLSDEFDIDDAWRAARLASVDAEIAAMPMQMMTVVGDRASTFSGGQIQRIRLAAALVRSPRVLLLDEATSWLDARSQAEVMRSVERLSATRIVIAHRLSTIREADRIYVLEAGRVAQCGSFDELSSAEGAFRRLVRRQLV